MPRWRAGPRLVKCRQMHPHVFPSPAVHSAHFPCVRARNGQMLKGMEIAKWHQEERADVINWKIGAKGETASYKCLPSKSSILF